MTRKKGHIMKMNDAPEKGKPLDDSMLENVTGGGTPAEEYYTNLCQYIAKMMTATDPDALTMIFYNATVYVKDAAMTGTVSIEAYEGDARLLSTVYQNRLCQLLP